MPNTTKELQNFNLSYGKTGNSWRNYSNGLLTKLHKAGPVIENIRLFCTPQTNVGPYYKLLIYYT
jgi:hypothetical protein